MNDKYFLDSNVLIYAHDRSDPHKQSIAEDLILKGIQNEHAVLSTQVLGEFFVNVTRKISRPLSEDDAGRVIRALSVLTVCPVDWKLVDAALEIKRQMRLSYWDALILAAARSTGCSLLYSEDLSHNEEYLGVQVINPFLQGLPA